MTDPDVIDARRLQRAAQSAVQSIEESRSILLMGSPRLDAIREALAAIEPLCRKLEADEAGPVDGGDLGGPGPSPKQPHIDINAAAARGTRVETPDANVQHGRGYAEGGILRPRVDPRVVPNVHIQQFDDLLFVLRVLRQAEGTLKRLDNSGLLGVPEAVQIQQLLRAIDVVRPLFTRQAI